MGIWGYNSNSESEAYLHVFFSNSEDKTFFFSTFYPLDTYLTMTFIIRYNSGGLEYGEGRGEGKKTGKRNEPRRIKHFVPHQFRVSHTGRIAFSFFYSSPHTLFFGLFP